MIEIDGAMGEGGGQVLRSAVGLSALTGQPVAVGNIRIRRKNPGLGRQHLTAVRAAAQICGAVLCGDEMGSTRLRFEPGEVRGGEYQFSVGTAGSANLVLQTVLPALMLADEPSALTLEGGTHNQAAPPFQFLERVFGPLLGKMGPKLSLNLDAWGFYPAGGGCFTATIQPVSALTPLDLGERGYLRTIGPTAVCGLVPRSVGRRELAVVSDRLGLGRPFGDVVVLKRPRGPGNVVMIAVESEHVTELFTGFGKRGVSAEQVAEGVCTQVRAYLDHDAPVGPYLADQLLIPMALAGSGSFRTGPLSLHTKTNLQVVERFLPVKFKTTDAGGGTWQVAVVS